MGWLITKYLLTAVIVVFVSELAKRSDKFGGLVAALPLITVLTLIWLYLENQPVAKIGQFARYTFWYVIPTLPLFLIFPFLLPKLGFWLSLAISIIIVGVCLVAFASLLRRYGVELF